MALPSGIYTIENVKYHNWAMLLNANEGEVVAGSSASTNVGEKVSTLHWKSEITIDVLPNLVVVHQPTGKRDLYFAESTLRRKLCELHLSWYHVGQGNSFQHLGLQIDAHAVAHRSLRSWRELYVRRSANLSMTTIYRDHHQGYPMWTATAIGVYPAPILKLRYCCSPWCSLNRKLKHRFASGWARRIQTQWLPAMEHYTGCRNQLTCRYVCSICFSHQV